MTIDRPIAIAVILFIILLLIFFLVVPQYKIFVKLQLDLAEKTAEFNAERDYYVAIAKTADALQEHQDDIKKVDDALPKNPTFGNLIYFLQQTAKENGLISKDLFLSKTSKNNLKENSGANVKDVAFSMDLIGDHSSLENFIISLEKSARIFEVTSISFGSSSVSQPGMLQAQQAYNFSLQIKTHSY